MSVSITTMCSFKKPILIEMPDCDLIISGIIRTTTSITLRVRNLIILGEVITASTLTIYVSEEILNFGNVHAKGVISKAFVNVLDARVIEKLGKLQPV